MLVDCDEDGDDIIIKRIKDKKLIKYWNYKAILVMILPFNA